MRVYIVLLIFLTTCLCSSFAQQSKQTFCQNNQCLTCIGRYCTTTCRGDDCKNCPVGDCCDSANCNICRGQKCCSTSECNKCVTKCLSECQGQSTCHYDCFQECLPNDPEVAPKVDLGNKTYGHLVSNKNYSPVNVTTIINITNTVRNENFIRHPIIVNSTNVNNFSGNLNSYHRKQIVISPVNPVTNNSRNTLIPDIAKQNCCEVVHPEICQNVEEQNNVCYIGKHRECSSICIAQHVHIVEDKEQKHQCVFISRKPYFFCGNYVVEDCDNCYTCTDDPDCDANCPQQCQATLIAEDFYNKMYRKD